jgi:hypothetical protein
MGKFQQAWQHAPTPPPPARGGQVKGRTPAVRAMKARRSSAVYCGCWVSVGTVIIKRAGRWICRTCALAHIAADPFTASCVTAAG